MSVNKDKKSGKWYYSGKYKDLEGNYKDYKKRGFTRKSEAKAAEEVFLSKLGVGKHRITLDSLVELYSEEYRAFNVKEATLVGDESYYKNHIKEIFGDKYIDDISTSDVEHFKIHLINKRKPKSDEGYAEQTINHALSVFSKYLSFAVKKGRLSINPCSNVKKYRNTTKIKKHKHNENFWEDHEYIQFLSIIKDDYWICVFEFLYGTGLREGELFALSWKDMDFKKSEIHISKSLTSKTKDYGPKVTSVKNINSHRHIDLQRYLSELLLKRYNKVSKTDGFTDDYFIFGDIKPMSRSTLSRYLDKYIEIANVKRITPHGFRHSHATSLIIAGVDDTLIAERLGHTVYELRNTYSHIYKSQREDLKNTLDNMHKKRQAV